MRDFFKLISFYFQKKLTVRKNEKEIAPTKNYLLERLKDFEWELWNSRFLLPLIYNFNAATTIMRLDDGQLLSDAFFHVVHVADDTDHTVFTNLF